MRTLFLTWQNKSKSQLWFVIGRLDASQLPTSSLYQFMYVQGVREAMAHGFKPLASFPKLDQVYESPVLFPFFDNRVPKKSRPDYVEYIQRLNLDSEDPVSILSRSGGQRATDNFEIFPLPQKTIAGTYQIHFLAHGLSHLPDESRQKVLRIHPQDKLSICRDIQNPVESSALFLRTEDYYNVGFCPRYLCQEFNLLLKKNCTKSLVSVERVNPPPSPIQTRLLCKFETPWPIDKEPFNATEYQPIPSFSVTNPRV